MPTEFCSWKRSTGLWRWPLQPQPSPGHPPGGGRQPAGHARTERASPRTPRQMHFTSPWSSQGHEAQSQSLMQARAISKAGERQSGVGGAQRARIEGRDRSKQKQQHVTRRRREDAHGRSGTCSLPALISGPVESLFLRYPKFHPTDLILTNIWANPPPHTHTHNGIIHS